MVQLLVPVVKIDSRKELKRIWTSNQEKKAKKTNKNALLTSSVCNRNCATAVEISKSIFIKKAPPCSWRRGKAWFTRLLPGRKLQHCWWRLPVWTCFRMNPCSPQTSLLQQMISMEMKFPASITRAPSKQGCSATNYEPPGLQEKRKKNKVWWCILSTSGTSWVSTR